MAVSTYLLTFLARESVKLAPAFPAKYPCSWLIWEPGKWRPATTTRQSNQATTITDPSVFGRASRPVGTDAFCFHLDEKPGVELTLGRASTSDILVNDLTLSRTHLLLRGGATWEASVAPTCPHPTTFGDQAAPAGAWTPLTSGLSIGAGAVRLTYYDVAGMLARLDVEAKRGNVVLRTVG